MKINGRRIVVDVERGRTVKGWKPRRLGKNTSNFRWWIRGYQKRGKRYESEIFRKRSKKRTK